MNTEKKDCLEAEYERRKKFNRDRFRIATIVVVVFVVGVFLWMPPSRNGWGIMGFLICTVCSAVAIAVSIAITPNYLKMRNIKKQLEKLE
jgi:ribosomal protein L33